jgi:hypothetical protein
MTEVNMQLNWRLSESTNKPTEIDNTSSPCGVYVRKYIKEVQDTESDIVKYQYQEAFLTSEEYQQYSLLQQINEQILQEDQSEAYLLYKQKLDTPVLYETNGHYYKPKWAADIYEGLINRGEKFEKLFPLTIWDSTELPENAEKMTLEQLKELTIFLGSIQETYFNEYKLNK